MRRIHRAGAAALLALVLAMVPSATRADGIHVLIDPVGFDQWVYPFNGTPGLRNAAPLFGAVGETDFDNKDGQLLIVGDTAGAGIPAGLNPNSYDVTAVRVTASHWLGSFAYDPTYDAWQTYLDPADPDHVADSDAGRPIELYGIGLRNGFTDLSLGGPAPGAPDYEESEGYGLSGKGGRNAFPLDFGTPDPEGDVSNNVTPPALASGFDPIPWAIGVSTSGLAAGDPVPQGTFGVSSGETFAFDVDLSDPRILDYVQEGLRNGKLGFAIVSMHETAVGGGSNPNFYTSESVDGFAVAPTLEISVNLPECSDGIDNDGDGFVDFGSDPGCVNGNRPTESPRCQDGIDNDGDGEIDFDGGASHNGGVPQTAPDISCGGDPGHGDERFQACGLGFEAALVLPALAALRRRRGLRP